MAEASSLGMLAPANRRRMAWEAFSSVAGREASHLAQRGEDARLQAVGADELAVSRGGDVKAVRHGQPGMSQAGERGALAADGLQVGTRVGEGQDVGFHWVLPIQALGITLKSPGRFGNLLYVGRLSKAAEIFRIAPKGLKELC